MALLKRAEFESEACRRLVEQIAERERDALGKAFGRVESRSRFKGRSGQPLLEARVPSFLYIDESGISAPEPNKGRATFTMGAIAIDSEDAVAYRHAADELKRRFFGTTELTLHEPMMRHRDGPYALSGSSRRQQQFDDAVADLIRSSRFVAFGVAVRKTAFEAEFVTTGIDRYLPTDADAVAIHMLLERYVDFLAMNHPPRLGKVIFESQGAREDADRQFEVARVLVDGTQWISEKVFRHWVAPGVQFEPKQGSAPMELADMLARDLYEWVDSDCTVMPKWWRLFSEKVYCREDGRMGKFGIKVFPDSDIRERIEAHRQDCGAEKY
jgi:hypothetical protein